MILELPWGWALAAISGLLFGSFLNVCIYRIPRDLSVVAPRSFCPECQTPVAWYDNLPLVSWLLLRGRCRHCQHAIDIRYPLVELTTALLVVAAIWRFGLGREALKVILFEMILIVLFWTDLMERILPDELTLGGSLVGLILSAWVPQQSLVGEVLLAGASRVAQSLTGSAVGAIALAGSLWLLALVVAKLRTKAALRFERSKKPTLREWANGVLEDLRGRDEDGYGGEVLGLGDVKLLALIGIFLGLEGGLFALLIGSLTGSILGVIYLRFTRQPAATYRLPFGSFLCAGAGIAALFPITG